jgi:hypothetical protein
MVATTAGDGPEPTGGLFPKEGQTIDPNRAAAEAQNLTLPARIALPALLSGAQHEQQLEAALRDNDPKRPRANPATTNAPEPVEFFELVAGESSYAEFSKKLLEEKIVTRSAMRAPPKTSALNGNVNVTQTAEVANDILNEMQRNSGGDTVEEDESRYQVTVRLPDSPETPEWTGEVAGPPQLFVLKTVNIIVAGKSLIVLDKSNKRVWQATLTYPVAGHSRGFFARDEASFGEGPCVEHGDTLYVFDQAVLSAFALSNGDARWRAPSVGVVGLFFDDAGDIYVNTTSANPDDIKYSRQIDVSKQTDDVLMKLDPKTGKTLWSIKPGGFVSYLQGKYIYAYQSHDPNPTDEENISEAEMSLQKPAFLHITRINPKNGRTMWEYYDRNRCPVDIRFHENSIELVFKREVQVLRYLSF